MRMRKGNIFWGAFFIVGAIFLVISQMKIFPDLSVWSVLLTIFFASCFVGSLISKSFGGIFFSIAFIGIIYDKQLGIERLTPWTLLLAALLLTIGFNILIKKKKYRIGTSMHNPTGANSDAETETIDDTGEIPMEFYANLGGGIKYVNSEDFKTASVRCNMGGMSLYFDNAVIQGDEAVLKFDISISGVELYIPKHWQISNELNLFLSDLEEKNHNRSDGRPVLRLIGDAKLSGVTVIYI